MSTIPNNPKQSYVEIFYIRKYCSRQQVVSCYSMRIKLIALKIGFLGVVIISLHRSHKMDKIICFDAQCTRTRTSHIAHRHTAQFHIELIRWNFAIHESDVFVSFVCIICRNKKMLQFHDWTDSNDVKEEEKIIFHIVSE